MSVEEAFTVVPVGSVAAAPCLSSSTRTSLLSKTITHNNHDDSSIPSIPRGGSSTQEVEEQSEDDDDDDDSESDEESDSDENENINDLDANEKDPLSSVISNEPVTVLVRTNVGNKLVDQSLELLVSRTRDVASLKQTLSRQLPGRPPVAALTLLSSGTARVLNDDELVDELVDDDDDDDDDEEEGDNDEQDSNTLILILDMVPPVDPKFATTFGQLEDLSTSDLLDAYVANAAAMYNNAQSLVSSSVSSSANDEAFASLSMQLRHEAYRIREHLTSTFPESALEKLQRDTPPSHETQTIEQWRGQRYRKGRGGAKTNMKRTIQRNLNVNWPDTIRNFMLFIFFGLFGGRNSVSKNLLLLGAPLCFVLQARPVKILLKQCFYALANPPGILLSLLPAPQQAILSFDEDDARETLYGVDINAGVDDDEEVQGTAFNDVDEQSADFDEAEDDDYSDESDYY